jgi:hypothetical protein
MMAALSHIHNGNRKREPGDAVMQAEIETLEHTEGGWLLRFRSRSRATWTATKEKLKVLIDYPGRYWDDDALDGKGAWFIEEKALGRISHLFSNYSFCRWVAEEAERQRVAARQAEERRRREAEEQAGRVAIPLDYHQAFTLLRLPESAPVKRIQEQYRQLALKHHPDLGGAHLAMVALNAAYRLALAYAEANTAA